MEEPFWNPVLENAGFLFWDLFLFIVETENSHSLIHSSNAKNGNSASQCTSPILVARNQLLNSLPVAFYDKP